MKPLLTTFLISLFFFTATFAQHNTDQALLGVYANNISGDKAKKLGFEQVNGSYITSIMLNSAAEKYDIQPFDYVYRIGENDLKPHQSIRNALSNYRPGDTVMIYYIRKGEKQSKEIVLGNESDARTRKRSRSEDPFLGIASNHKKLPGGVNGVRVTVVENSTAEEIGLQDDDIITHVNGFPTLDWHDLGTAIDALEVNDEIAVTYQRGSKVINSTSPIKSLAASKGDSEHNSYTYNYSYSYDKGTYQSGSQQDIESGKAAEIKDIADEMKDMEVEMVDMPEEDAREMKKELGIDMPLVQDLEIERLNIFPNPSEGMFNIRFNLPNSGATAIRVFNATGKMIYANDLGRFSGDFNGRIDLTNNPAGTYYLMVQQEDYSISKKVVVVRR